MLLHSLFIFTHVSFFLPILLNRLGFVINIFQFEWKKMIEAKWSMIKFNTRRLREIMNSDTDFVTDCFSKIFNGSLDDVLDDEFWFPQIIEFYTPRFDFFFFFGSHFELCPENSLDRIWLQMSIIFQWTHISSVFQSIL